MSREMPSQVRVSASRRWLRACLSPALSLALLLGAMTSGCAEKQRSPVLVSVATSAKEALADVAKDFQTSSGVEISLNPGPTSGLANQIIEGAPADLFLSASRQWADEIARAGLADVAVPLLTNRLVLVVPAGNRAQVHSPDDLLSDRVQKIALAGDKVPAGIYAEQSLHALGLLDRLSTAGKIARGQDVRVTLAYVERGEAEAGIVYATDVRAASGVEIAYTFSPATHDEIAYVLVLLKSGKGNESARRFFEFLQSDAADPSYTRHGFSRLERSHVSPALPPPSPPLPSPR